jgi:hypothetical protein
MFVLRLLLVGINCVQASLEAIACCAPQTHECAGQSHAEYERPCPDVCC